MQKTPTLYTAATVGDANSDPSVYGPINPFIVNYGDVLEIVLNNHDTANHPFHLHGHQFQVISRPKSNSGNTTGSSGSQPALDINPIPPQRDVVTVNARSYVVLRIVANNPGVFLFHCHIEWHVEMGLTATLIEAPEMLHDYPIPQTQIDSCKAQGIPTAGNAAGNLEDPFDTSDFITTPPTMYYGAQWPVPGGVGTGTSSPGKLRRWVDSWF